LDKTTRKNNIFAQKNLRKNIYFATRLKNFPHFSEPWTKMDRCMGCRPNTSEWLLDGFTCYYCSSQPHQKKLEDIKVNRRLLNVLNQIKEYQDYLKVETFLLEALRDSVLAENTQLAVELELANAAWRREREMRLVSEKELVAMKQKC
jgi:hypothetical protein